MRRRISRAWLVRVAVSAGVVAMRFHFVPVGAIWQQAQRISPAPWAARAGEGK